MKKRIAGLAHAALPINEVPDGFYLVRVQRLQYRWDKQKPFYAVRLTVIEPDRFAGASVSGRLYCTEKALWKLSWFLRDFGYDPELLSSEEVDEARVTGLSGVIKISHTIVNGRTYLNLHAFASAGEWEQFQALPVQSETAIQYGSQADKPEIA